MSGRPTVITARVVRLLVTSFHNGLTIRQACWQSGISHEAYYQRLRNDEEFADKMAKAQQMPSITARANVMTAIKKGDVSASKWLLERKDKEEFSTKSDIAIQEEEVEVNIEEVDEELLEALSGLDQLIIHKYKMQKHALINNYCIGYGISKYGPIQALYDLSDEELLRLAHQDMANGTYDTPDVEGVFKADKPMPEIDDSKLPPHVKRKSAPEKALE